MKLKLDANGNVVLVDGKPVYVHDDGSEHPFDAAATVASIGRLNGEAKGHRERAETAEKALKAFDGIENAADAKKALETLKNLDAKKLVDAGEVEKVKLEAIKAIEEKYAPVLAERDGLQKQLISEKIGGSFARSKYIADSLAIPHDLVEARFGSSFKLEDGKVVAYDHQGNKLFSKQNAGEVAGFDEALSLLVGNYPYKDSILKSSGQSGGSAQNNGKGSAGAKSIGRGDFEGMAPAAQREFIKSGGALTD